MDISERLDDLINQAGRGRPACSQFLDPSAQAEAARRCKNRCAFAFEGGYDEAERRMLVITPDFMQQVSPGGIMSAVFITPRGGAPRHGDYLGALLALGLKREALGDIVIKDEGAAVIMTQPAAALVKAELTSVGRYSVSVEEALLPLEGGGQSDGKEVSFTVASLRLDCVIDGALGLSRNAVSELVEAGSVCLNYAQTLDRSKPVREGDVISVRKFGRIKILGLGGVSKKGRQRINAEVFGAK